MNIRAYLLLAILMIQSFLWADETDKKYEFRGTHFIAEYFDCDFASMGDTDTLIAVINEAVKKSGATVLNTMYHLFPSENNICGLTLVTMLSESHASIHTYPEHQACFVDLFTCGDHCSHEEFDKELRSYLRPQKASYRVITRPDLLDKDSAL